MLEQHMSTIQLPGAISSSVNSFYADCEYDKPYILCCMALYIVDAPDIWELAGLVSIFQCVLLAVYAAKERASMCMRLP